MIDGTRQLLIATVIIGHAVLALAASGAPRFLDIIDAPVTLTLAQMSLLSLWVAFGHGNLLLRWGAVLAGGLCLTGLILWSYSNVWPSSDVGRFVAGAAAVTFAPLLCVTIPSNYVRMYWVEVNRPDELSQTRRQLQFSLRHLLAWITILSLLLALCRLLAGVTDGLGQFPLVIVFAGLAGFIGFMKPRRKCIKNLSSDAPSAEEFSVC